MTKRNIIIIIVVAVTVFNVSALATVLFMRFQTKNDASVIQETESEQEELSKIELPQGRYALWFRDQLRLNNEQFDVFRNANRKYHQQGAAILDELAATRNGIVTELGKEYPDEGELKYLSERIGELHVQLKELTINYYLSMKEVCTPEQEQKLYEIFKAMTDAEGNANIPER